MMIVIKVGFDNNDNDGDDIYIDGQDRFLWMLMMMITEQMIMIFKMIMTVLMVMMIVCMVAP